MITRQSRNLQLSLFEGFEGDEAPRFVSAQMVNLEVLVEALLREFAAALANGEASDEQDHD